MFWSAEAPDFVSENAQILQVIDTVRTPTQGRGIYVMDRGFERAELLHPLLDRRLRFIVRLVGDRHLIGRRGAQRADEIVRACTMRYAETVTKEGLDTEKKLPLEFGCVPVKLPERPEQLYLVVVRGFGEEPMLLLTSVALTFSRKSLWAIVRGYLCRWLVEETIRFIKQSHHLEDMRVLRYERLRNLTTLVLAAVYVLRHALRDNLLKGSELARAQFDTLRLKLLKIGARLEAGRTFLRFHFPAVCPARNDWQRLGAILNALNSA